MRLHSSATAVLSAASLVALCGCSGSADSDVERTGDSPKLPEDLEHERVFVDTLGNNSPSRALLLFPGTGATSLEVVSSKYEGRDGKPGLLDYASSREFLVMAFIGRPLYCDKNQFDQTNDPTTNEDLQMVSKALVWAKQRYGITAFWAYGFSQGAVFVTLARDQFVDDIAGSVSDSGIHHTQAEPTDGSCLPTLVDQPLTGFDQTSRVLFVRGEQDMPQVADGQVRLEEQFPDDDSVRFVVQTGEVSGRHVSHVGIYPRATEAEETQRLELLSRIFDETYSASR